MAQRLRSEERALIEAMAAAGVGVEETAWRLGRQPLDGVSRTRSRQQPRRL